MEELIKKLEAAKLNGEMSISGGYSESYNCGLDTAIAILKEEQTKKSQKWDKINTELDKKLSEMSHEDWQNLSKEDTPVDPCKFAEFVNQNYYRIDIKWFDYKVGLTKPLTTEQLLQEYKNILK